MAPFARALDADRKAPPGYSWPPHLYQEKKSLRERAAKGERNFKWIPSGKLLELERLEGYMLRGDQEFARESAFRGPAPQRFFSGEPHEIRIVVFLGRGREPDNARSHRNRPDRKDIR